MSLAVLRWSAIPLGLLAFALRVAGHRWLAPLIADRESAADDWVRVAVDLVALVVPGAIYLLLARGDRHRPARFLAGNGGLTVPQNPTTAVVQSLIWFFIGAAPFLSGRDLSPPLSAVMLIVSWAGAIAFLLVRRPQLYLDPEGMTLHQLVHTTRVRWDQLIPGNPLPPSKKDRSLRVFIHGTPIHGMWPSIQIPIRFLHIDPAFLAETLRHYGEHPEDRATIGVDQVKASTL